MNYLLIPLIFRLFTVSRAGDGNEGKPLTSVDSQTHEGRGMYPK